MAADQRPTPLTLGFVDRIGALGRGGRTVASVAAAMPAWRGESLVDTLTRLEAAGLSLNSEAVSLTPGCHDVSNGIDTQIVSLRGVNRYHSFFLLQ